ncbi:NAD(P)-dependent oxidoreductase [Devosia sp.]|uniref:NAD-dependent epimerase/dehydratase family protein n=1 Tax=Devosia sp. TaxID=1871048 RepID=UPI001AD0546F|nr:NAD-dependent epimerase/dehydratase family protein [Devosia sp.]MBN9333184.1 NAD-dependent epimerase/dehydratase family protein [Devosia sp.]
MTVAIISGSGFLGRHVALRLLAHGKKPLVVHRGLEKANLPDSVAIAHADRVDEERLADILSANDVNAVIDIFALSAANTLGVMRAAKRIGARYVLTSSVDVYSNYAGLLRKGTAPVRIEPATEDSPLRQMRYPYRGNSRRPAGVSEDLFENYDKLVLEEALAGMSMDWSVVRPPMIFGPDDKQRRFGWIVDNARPGVAFAIDERAYGWLNSYGYVEDVAEAMVLAATHPNAAGQIYNAGQDFVRPAHAWAERVLPLLGLNNPVVKADAGSGVWADRADAMDLTYPLTLDTRKIRQELGFAEVVSEDVALDRTLSFYR